MKRLLFNPLLFLMANTSDVEKNLELLMSMLQATNKSVKNIKNGVDGFHASILKMASTTPGQPPGWSPPTGTNPTDQTPGPETKPEASPEPENRPEPNPNIQMPTAAPPDS